MFTVPFLKHYLASKFKWTREVGFTEEYNPDAGKNIFIGDQVCRYWLSMMLGFRQYNGNIVQVNPADLYALQFFPKGTKFESVVQEVRIIPLEETDYLWTYNTFYYYFKSLTGQSPNSEKLITKGLIPSEILNHPLVKDHEQLQYVKNRTMLKEDILRHLYPLDTVLDYGWSPQIDKALSNRQIKEDGSFANLHDWRSYFKQEKDLEVFTGGTYIREIKYDIKIKDDIELTAARQNLANYLKSYKKKQEQEIYTEFLKEDLIKQQVYPISIVKSRRFMKEVFIPDAESLGFTIQHELGQCRDSSTKELGPRRWVVRVEQPKTKSKRKAK